MASEVTSKPSWNPVIGKCPASHTCPLKEMPEVSGCSMLFPSDVPPDFGHLEKLRSLEKEVREGIYTPDPSELAKNLVAREPFLLLRK